MLGYEELEPGQRKYVDLVSLLYSDIGTEITYKKLNEIHADFLSIRERNPAYKIGYPNWLLVHNRIGKGRYFLPKKGVDKPTSSVTIRHTEYDDMYFSLLSKFNLERK
jgi:hypothetical protein